MWRRVIANGHSLALSSVSRSISLFLIPFSFVLRFVPESVRWLLVSGHKDKAMAILEKVAQVNKREMPKEDLNVPYSPPNKGCLELFATRKLVILTLIQCYAW